MHKSLGVVGALIALAGCGGPPEPIRLADLEQTDRAFAQPSPEDRPGRAPELLKKDSLTLDDVLALAEAMNPQLAAERKNVDLATAAVWDAGLYPNPFATLQVEDYRTRGGFGSSKRTAGVGIPLVVSGRIGAATSVAEKERDAAAANFVWRRREFLTEVKRAFTAHLAARRSSELLRETRDLAKSFRDVTNERFKAQAVPEMELLKASVQLARSESDLKLAERDLAVSLKTLQTLMGADLPKATFTGDLVTRFGEPSLEGLRAQLTNAHPLLGAAMREREAAVLRVALVRAERIPDLGLEIRGGVDGAGDAVVEGGLSVPLPLFNRAQARLASAEIQARRAEDVVAAVRNDLLLRLATAHAAFLSAQERVKTYLEDILPKAERANGQTQEGYRLGKFSYLDVLDSQRTLADARIAYAASLAELNLAATELEKISGTRLEPAR